MAKTYRVGVASLVHDHVWGELQHWRSHAQAEIVAVGDVNDVLRRRAGAEFGVEHVYSSWREMLAAHGDSLDIVQVASENNVHAEIVEACAALGIHVIVEKPMAATLDGAARMARASEGAGTLLMVNWPNAWTGAYQEFERRILAGAIGDIRYLKYRSAHNGPREIGCDPHFVAWLYDAEKNGGGAFMDYCCYGSALCARFLGRPDTVTGLRAVLAKDYPLPDDNGLIAMQYAHAFGVAEGSWTQPTGYVAANLVAYGSEGALSVEGSRVTILRPGGSPETLNVPPLTAPLRSGPEYLIHCLETGTAPVGLCSISVSLTAQEILEAGFIAAQTGIAQKPGTRR